MSVKKKALALLYNTVLYFWHRVGSVKYTTKVANDPTSFRLIELGFGYSFSFPIAICLFSCLSRTPLYSHAFLNQKEECVNKYVLYPIPWRRWRNIDEHFSI